MARAADELHLDPDEHISGLGANLDRLSPTQRARVQELKTRTRGLPPVTANADYLTADALDGILVRFLIARQWDVEKSFKLFLDAMRWRMRRPAHRWFMARENQQDPRFALFRKCSETGKIRVPGVDRHGK